MPARPVTAGAGRTRSPWARLLAVLAPAALALAACGGAGHSNSTASGGPAKTRSASSAPTRDHQASRTTRQATTNVYAADRAGDLSPVVRRDPALVYVPNSLSNTVDEISQKTFKIVREFPTGALPQHVTPSYDLKTLYVDNDAGNSLTPINPQTGLPGRPIAVEDPYNLYFTPDGRFAIVVAERLQRLDFRNPQTMRLVHSLAVPQCPGVDHMDFSADGRYAYASCEFGGAMIEVDLRTQRVIRRLVLNHGRSSPQDVKLSPDGRTLYVADMDNGGLWEINPDSFRVTGFLKTGAGAHGLYPSRDARVLYVSNRAAGSISVVSFKTRQVITTWQLPMPASPDMGGVSADGRTLWLSGRYDAVVYAINTQTGRLRATIPVGQGATASACGRSQAATHWATRGSFARPPGAPYEPEPPRRSDQ
ncbi:MAG TPA: YncE family protein [Solirubrobacteraceae bacterium]|nr:YncE family protein [Solirubrobacteraceae bacterium]